MVSSPEKISERDEVAGFQDILIGMLRDKWAHFIAGLIPDCS